MNIAVLGTGNVGGTLGRRWAQAGHTVTLGSRDPNSTDTQALVEDAGPNARAATPPEAASDAEVIVLALPWKAVEATLKSLGDLHRRIVIDCTNPIGLGGTLAVAATTSGAEQVAAWAEGARVVKAFNTTGAQNMADPNYDSLPLMMPLCGDDAEAKQTVAGLAEALGFDPIDVGPLPMARHLESLAMLWITLAYRQNLGSGIGFALLRR